MQRRDFFKALGTLAALPLVAPIAALFRPQGFTHYAEVHGLRILETEPEPVILTANDDLFGPERDFLDGGQQDEAVRLGVAGWYESNEELYNILKSERGVPTIADGEKLNYWVLSYRRTGGGELGYREIGGY